MQLIRIGSLVMWNVESSEDYGCMGLVVYSQYTDFFNVRWADNSLVEYEYGQIEYGRLKVVKF
mgnify:CR=1 FL=1